jgi:hypothetical protein
LGSFEDYPIPPFGDAGSGDVAYRRNIDLTFDTAAVEAVISGLFTRFGADGPQSQLPALFQAASGEGQDLSGVGFPGANISPGQQANFRAGATKLFLLWTDAPFHLPGDPGDIPYPGPSFAETVNAILALDPPKVIGISSGGGGLADLQAIAAATNAVAPPGGVDCNGDGIIDIPEGEPLVCTIASSGVGIGEAILAIVEAAVVTEDIVKIQFAQLYDLSGSPILFVSATSTAAPEAKLAVTVPGCVTDRPMNLEDGQYVFTGLIPECSNIALFAFFYSPEAVVTVTSNLGGSASLPMQLYPPFP